MGRIILLMLRVTDPDDEERIEELTGWAERLLFSLRIVNDFTNIEGSVEELNQNWWRILSLPVHGSEDDLTFVEEMIKELCHSGPEAAMQEVHLIIRLGTHTFPLPVDLGRRLELMSTIGTRIVIGLNSVGFNTNFLLVLPQSQPLPDHPFTVLGFNKEGFLRELLLETLHTPRTKIYLINCEGIHEPEDYCNFVLITDRDPGIVLSQNGCPQGCGEKENLQVIYEFTLRELFSWMEDDELLKVFVFQAEEEDYQEIDRWVVLDVANQLLKQRVPVRIEPDNGEPSEPDDETPASPSQDPLLDFED